MKMSSKQTLYCALWLLAGVLLAGLNLFQLLTLEPQQPAAYTPIRELQANLQRFDTILSAHGSPFMLPLTLQNLKTPPPATIAALPVQSPTDGQSDQRILAPMPETLPALSGIIQTFDPNGSVYFQAVLNGHSYREKELLGEYSIDRITPAGVILLRAGKTWFVQCPTPFFSSDQGE